MHNNILNGLDLIDEYADTDGLAGLQQRDGGWTVDFEPASAAAALEWRGYATVQAIAILKRNGDRVR